MSLLEQGFAGVPVRLVSDNAYLGVAQSLMRRARRCCLCSLFTVDLTPTVDFELLVDTLLVDLQAARWLGLDARLLIGGSRTNIEIAEVALAALYRARQLRIETRLLQSRPVRGSHVKLVIADDFVLMGSHNWSVGAFTNHLQDSVLLQSEAIAEATTALFEAQWARAKTEGAES